MLWTPYLLNGIRNSPLCFLCGDHLLHSDNAWSSLYQFFIHCPLLILDIVFLVSPYFFCLLVFISFCILLYLYLFLFIFITVTQAQQSLVWDTGGAQDTRRHWERASPYMCPRVSLPHPRPGPAGPPDFPVFPSSDMFLILSYPISVYSSFLWPMNASSISILSFFTFSSFLALQSSLQSPLCLYPHSGVPPPASSSPHSSDSDTQSTRLLRLLGTLFICLLAF